MGGPCDRPRTTLPLLYSQKLHSFGCGIEIPKYLAIGKSPLATGCCHFEQFFFSALSAKMHATFKKFGWKHSAYFKIAITAPIAPLQTPVQKAHLKAIVNRCQKILFLFIFRFVKTTC